MSVEAQLKHVNGQESHENKPTVLQLVLEVDRL